jgi:hypothetical protein
VVVGVLVMFMLRACHRLQGGLDNCCWHSAPGVRGAANRSLQDTKGTATQPSTAKEVSNTPHNLA